MRDKDSGRNGQVNCSLGDRDGPFRLVQLYDTEYQLVTSQSIDRESRAYYALVITCRDNGIKPLVTNKRLVVNVTDVNDRTPVFLPTSYRATLFERNYRGMVVMQVRMCVTLLCDPSNLTIRHFCHNLHQYDNIATPGAGVR